MESLKSIASMLGKWLRPAPRPLALESSALRKLPSELIHNIARFLPLQSASSFSLCCRPIYFILGTQYLKALETSHWHRYEFLMLLERELPDHIVCYHCKKLHSISQARRYIYSTNIRYVDRSLQLPCIGESLTAQRVIHPYFSFNVFQMTMKRYRQGLDYSELLNLLSYETKTSPHYGTETSLHSGFVEQCSWLFRVVGGSLLFRKQIIIMLPPTQPIMIPRELESCICPHLLPLWIMYFLEQKHILDRGRGRWRGLWRVPGGGKMRCQFGRNDTM